jgi:hypothetical protein
VTDIIETFDPEIPVSATVAAEREAVRWAMTHSLAGLERDEAESARLAAELPDEGPTTREEVDAMMVTTSLRLSMGVQRRVQAVAAERGVKPTALMRGWIEQMLTAAEVDRPISLQDALRVLTQLPESHAA